jgi:hypothetical protein
MYAGRGSASSGGKVWGVCVCVSVEWGLEDLSPLLIMSSCHCTPRRPLPLLTPTPRHYPNHILCVQLYTWKIMKQVAHIGPRLLESYLLRVGVILVYHRCVYSGGIPVVSHSGITLTPSYRAVHQRPNSLRIASTSARAWSCFNSSSSRALIFSPPSPPHGLTAPAITAGADPLPLSVARRPGRRCLPPFNALASP